MMISDSQDAVAYAQFDRTQWHLFHSARSPEVGYRFRGSLDAPEEASAAYEDYQIAAFVYWALQTNLKGAFDQHYSIAARSCVPKWLREARHELRALRALHHNWDGRGSPAPTSNAVDHAERALDMIYQAGLTVKRVLATPEGGVGLYGFAGLETPQRGSKYIRIGTYNSGEVLFERGILGGPDVAVVTVGDEGFEDLSSCLQLAQSYLLSA
jgi:hypothetical protein